MAKNQILLLAIGNDIHGDEGIAIMIGREIQPLFKEKIVFSEISDTGMELLEILEGYEKSLILTIVNTSNNPIGTVEVININELNNSAISFLHYVSLTQVLNLAVSLNISLPKIIKLVTIEVKKEFFISEELSQPIKNIYPQVFERVRNILNDWIQNSQIKT
jgi:hydrogenase maturation protease